jgi:tRNA1Val (adenine37-N6)-methyltransferase
MPNTFFQFKQFTVHQEQSALKVSTDSCLFGAWSSRIASEKNNIKSILDIGTGTGLLILMLAQNVQAKIDGIEIDHPSFEEAQKNINNSPWKERLRIFKGDVNRFEFEAKYDLIISNPPFYEGDLKSDAVNRNLAMHDTGLKLNELLRVVNENLNNDGWFAVLLPYHRNEKFIAMAKDSNLFLLKRVDIKQTYKHSFFRSFLLFGRKKEEVNSSNIVVKDDANQYTPEFIDLLKEYYLYL